MALQKSLRGLLNYLGEFSNGRIAFNLPPTVQPTIAVEDFIEPWQFVWSGLRTLNASNSGTFTTVPDNEQWIVKNLTFQINSSTRTGNVQPFYTKPTIGNNFYIGQTYTIASLGADRGATWALDDQVFTPGDEIGLWLTNAGGSGNMNVQFGLNLKRILI